MIKRHETKLKWIKLPHTLHLLGFNDIIYHEGNLPKMPDVDVFSCLEFSKHATRSHGIKKMEIVSANVVFKLLRAI